MSRLLDSLLYQQAVTNGEYQYKSKFLYTVVYGQTKAVSKFLKAGVLMSAFDNYDEWAARIRYLSSCISEEKRLVSKEKSFHPLLAAAVFGNIDVIKVLLDEGSANIDFSKLQWLYCSTLCCGR
jgi:ankyrin repeat protein